MTGLNLEPLIRLFRADLGAWVSLGVIVLLLAVMTWTSWGSRRALRKCLFLSIAVHLGLIVYGASSPAVLKILRLDPASKKPSRAERPVRITPWVADQAKAGGAGQPSRKVPSWELASGSLAFAEPSRATPPLPPAPASIPSRAEPSRVNPEPVAPEIQAPPPPMMAAPAPPTEKAPEPPPTVAEGDPSEVPAAVELGSIAPAAVPPATNRVRPGLAGPGPSRTEPNRLTTAPPALAVAPNPVVSAPRVEGSGESGPTAPATNRADDLDPGPPVTASPVVTSAPDSALPDPGVRRAPRPTTGAVAGSATAAPGRMADRSAPSPLARVTPSGPSSSSTLARPSTRRSLSDVPPVYRSRLDPNRTVLAQRAGASVASEQAVERALDWLARHQDATDGRWDGGTEKVRDGGIAGNDDSFTIHCPAGEVCFGECIYWEADTALTGLSLLAYLGAGYTHLDGKYATTVAKGLQFLVKSQKSDGDLRGESLAVGMYCHSMATLALCEAYALTGDARLRGPAERAVGWLVRSKAVDGLAWRYAPGEATGDTSILGWAVMALKSAKTVGIPIPPATQAGVLTWLKKVGAGRDGGLALYQPGLKTTPTMTAEAWACRQFLEVGGPGKASEEAASFLVQSPSDRGEFNIYYLYYGTLAMYQHGGSAWSTWNARVRDDVVGRQRAKGHMAGSWDPDDSPYGSRGGRIYTTALATLTLEVYYRFLRLYEPAPPAPLAPRPGGDAGARRAGLEPGPPGR
jgi:hypothetical protein